MHQINRQRYVHDCLDKKIAIPPHLLDLEKCVTPTGHNFVSVVPFYFANRYNSISMCNVIIVIPFTPVYSVKTYRSGMPWPYDFVYTR
jgi:hypothetical protein